jgi:hypothetical protein
MGRPLSTTPSPSTLRGRRHRARQQNGCRTYKVDLHEDGLTQLIVRGFLREGDDLDDGLVGRALGAFIAAQFELRPPVNDDFAGGSARSRLAALD